MENVGTRLLVHFYLIRYATIWIIQHKESHNYLLEHGIKNAEIMFIKYFKTSDKQIMLQKKSHDILYAK